jgi:DNA-binding NarL/FixJ family response regulator
MTPDPAPPPADERTPVLIVDDEPQLLETMRLWLETDFSVDVANSAGAAETLMAARRFAVVVCDHLLPGEAGLDFLVRMRERHPDTRRILLTGYINSELFSRSIVVAGLSGCLLKPATRAELLSAVCAAAQR